MVKIETNLLNTATNDHHHLFINLLFLMCIMIEQFSSREIYKSCVKNLQLKPNKLILTQKSLNAGAKFLGAIQTNSFKECYYACCSTNQCTSAFYESKLFNHKSTHKCFMFDCRSAGYCYYADDPNYDLIYRDDTNNETVRIQVNLNEPCDHTHLCGTNKTICSNGICVCQSGWIAKNGHCVQSVCQSPELQFQCDDSSACVAIYDRCNGIPECPDGSDEDFCSKDNNMKTMHSSQNKSNIIKLQPGQEHSIIKSVIENSNIPNNLLKIKNSDNPIHRTPIPLSSSSSTSSSSRSSYFDLHELNQPIYYSHEINQNVMNNNNNNNNNNNVNEQQQQFYHKPNTKSHLNTHKIRKPWLSDLPNNLDHTYNNVLINYPKKYIPNTMEEEPEQEFVHSLSDRNLYPDDSSSIISNIKTFHPKNHKIFKSFLPNDQISKSYSPFNSFKPNNKFMSDNNNNNNNHFENSQLYHYYSLDSEPIISNNDNNNYNKINNDHSESEIIDSSVFDHSRRKNSKYYKKLHDNSMENEENKILKNYGSDYASLSREPEFGRGKKGNKESMESNIHQSPILTTTIAPGDLNSKTILNAIKTSQSEGYTAALLLSFSLGLICCFIGLLIAEWRRCQKLHLWMNNKHRTEQPIVFGNRTKISMPHRRSNHRIKYSNELNHSNTNEQTRALCDGLVL